MKKLLSLCAIICGFLYSCEKKPVLPQKYTVEIRVNNWTDINGDDYDTKEEEITAKNLKEAYATGYKNYMISKRVSQATNNHMARRMIISFRVLNEKRKNIVDQISKNSLDSIHTTVDKETAYITEDLKNKIENHRNNTTN
ncbi:hypothetical protein OF897_18350 [Chryseobacterium formosus]|uniref:DUF4136 domain-containing protein n=1 Tax=Chryseobacterium formosus TaxID=1537363 RepID=A0ABT3XW87_9FLAO|nr:hypothetical protein [Chryseobacterium formosus]MCX8525879.1 hypothetical protein [Chryseobacterium formosus]